MSATMTLPPSPQALADDAVRAILRTQYDGHTAVRLDSPPGAGKTGIVERLAVQSASLHGERCMVVTQTNQQAFDLARRLGRDFPRQRAALFVRRDLPLPEDLLALPNLAIVPDANDLPQSGPCIMISNASKWAWLREDVLPPFDLQVIDEAFQLPDYKFQQIANLAQRVVLVGDPGQIDPVVTCEIERWKCDPTGPHVASPHALLARHPDIHWLGLPVSRRLVPDTVAIVQPAFYPHLPFTALNAAGERGLATDTAGATALDDAIDLAEQGASLVAVELPPLITGEVDEALAEAIVATVARLRERESYVWLDNQTVEPLRPEMIGVVCAHVAQVNAVRERLPLDCADILVETADRFQGLERPVMLVYHPLSGRADASTFHLDAGRLCVMLSRHQVAGFIFTRGGVAEMLERYVPSGDRVLGVEDDQEYEGWRAHVALLGDLHRLDRVVELC
jgi:hypothetical protein